METWILAKIHVGKSKRDRQREKEREREREVLLTIEKRKRVTGVLTHAPEIRICLFL